MHPRGFRGRSIILIVVVCMALRVVAGGVLRQQIKSGLDRWCRAAQAAHPHPGDDIASLLGYVPSDAHSLRGRNEAVWALGQARDPCALPILKSHSTGEPCNHAKCLCQGELSKAISLCEGKTPNLLGIRTP